MLIRILHNQGLKVPLWFLTNIFVLSIYSDIIIEDKCMGLPSGRAN